MNATVQSNSSASRFVMAGIFQILGGLIVGGLFTSISAIQMLRYMFGGDIGPTSVIVMFVILGSTVLLVARGVSNCLLGSRFRKVSLMLKQNNRRKIEDLARGMRCTTEQAISRLSMMIAKGCWIHAYFDLPTKEFVVENTVPDMRDILVETELKQVKVRSIAPALLFGAVWLLYAVFIQYNRFLDFVVAAIISVLVYFIARMIIPSKTKVVEQRVKAPEPIKIETKDEVLQAANKNISEMVALNGKILDAKLSTKVSRLVEISRQILDHLVKQPEKVRGSRQFLNYYLPTTVKLLGSYVELSRQTVHGQNINDSMKRIDALVDALQGAYEKELDNLFQDKAMDISVDIDLMQNMLKQEGMVTDFFGAQE